MSKYLHCNHCFVSKYHTFKYHFDLLFTKYLLVIFMEKNSVFLKTWKTILQKPAYFKTAQEKLCLKY